MSQLRDRWEGVSLPGDYLLEKWLSGDDAAAFFEASGASDGRRAVVKLMPEPAVGGAKQLELWQRTRKLRHPNLRELLDCGRAELAGETVLYAVFESVEETLAGALEQAPLSEAEAREVLHSVLGALRYLQSRGLAHPTLQADDVAAVGEQIKLSTDALSEVAPDARYADQLRAFWYRISPGTFAWSADVLAEATAGFDAGPEVAVPAGVLPVEVVTAPPAVPRPRTVDFTPPERKRFPKWILVGAAGVVLLILGLNVRREPEVPVQPQPAPVPVAPPPVPKAHPAAKAASKPAPTGQKSWRVIAFAYRTRAAAAKKADQINEGHPELNAAVFLPREKPDYFLISLGGPMTREEADRLRTKALAARVARDVYVQNYVE